jgi:CBS domain-containing protein
MATLRDLLGIKGGKVLAIPRDATVFEAATRMDEHQVGSLVVMHESRMLGIITERDILRRVVAQRRDPGQTPVTEVMTAEVVCGQPHTTIEEARGVMKNRRIRHLPVTDGDGGLVGLISIGDLNAHETHDHEQTIHLLQEYISGHV